MTETTGKVTIVGAGPGDPELLTLKAARILKEAQIILHDRLVSSEIMAYINPEAELIYSGKSAKEHKMTQQQINKKLVEIASQGRDAVRLKGGDPFIFGRGGEEILHLTKHGIPFEIIPGVSAAMGCAALAGIPLTHRHLASSVQFITGHCKGNEGFDYDWSKLAQHDTTLVIFMGLHTIGEMARELIASGRAPDTPAVAIENGTTQRQRIVRAPLRELPKAMADAELKSPTLIIIGEVTALV